MIEVLYAILESIGAYKEVIDDLFVNGVHQTISKWIQNPTFFVKTLCLHVIDSVAYANDERYINVILEP
jgi:hypothetical protein